MLPRVEYGRTGLQVTRLCFGTGLFNPGRFNLTPDEGGALVAYGCELGINFLDTAVGYRTHPHVGIGIRSRDRASLVIQTKTGAASAADARAHVEQALREMGVEYVDLFLLHGVRSAEDFRRREGALDELCRAKEQGLIRAVGASTHVFTGSAVRVCIDDPRIEAILALINKSGLGLQGDWAEHQALLREAHAAGKGISAMKILGEGYLADDAEEHVRHAFTIPFAHAVNLGMASRPQVEMGVRIARGEPIPAELAAAARVGAKREWGQNFPNLYK